MENYQFAYLLTLLLQIIISLIILFRQGYFLKKGQNVADKEDISELTKIVEGVKSEFIRDNAKINADLDILKDRRGKTYSQAQQAIIAFYSDFSNVFYYMVNFTAQFQKEAHADEILEYAQKLKAKEDVSYSVMRLLVASEATLLDEAAKMHQQIFTLNLLVQAWLVEIRFDGPIKNDILEKLHQGQLNNASEDEMKKIEGRLKKNEERNKSRNDSYASAIADYKKTVNAIQLSFEHYAKEYLLG